MLKRLLKRATAIIIATAIALSSTIVTSTAASTEIKWDGVSQFQEGKTYYIDSEVKTGKTFTIPKDTTLNINDGGKLTIYTGGKFTVNGTMRIKSGGFVTNSGTIYVKAGGYFKNSGEIRNTLNCNFNLKGYAINYEDAIFRMSQKMTLYTDSQFSNYGDVVFLKTSEVVTAGFIKNTVKGEMMVQGSLSITKSGWLSSYGYLSVSSKGKVLIGGTMNLKFRSGYKNQGIISLTVNGKLVDNSTRTGRKEMSSAFLDTFPEVVSNGIDVSYAQGVIDWAKVKAAGIDFAIIRAGRSAIGNETSPQMDKYFVKNIEGAIANGINVGVYFYSYAQDVKTAEEDARFFVKIIKKYKITYPVILDMEEEAVHVDNTTAQIETFFNIVADSGYYPMLYSYKGWMLYNLDMRILDQYAVWLAEIEDAPTYDGSFYMWQYSFKGRVNGIKYTVDLDKSYRDFPSIFKQYGLNNL